MSYISKQKLIDIGVYLIIIGGTVFIGLMAFGFTEYFFKDFNWDYSAELIIMLLGFLFSHHIVRLAISEKINQAKKEGRIKAVAFEALILTIGATLFCALILTGIIGNWINSDFSHEILFSMTLVNIIYLILKLIRKKD